MLDWFGRTKGLRGLTPASGAGRLHAMNDIRPGPAFAAGLAPTSPPAACHEWPSLSSLLPQLHAGFRENFANGGGQVFDVQRENVPNRANAEAVLAGRIHARCSPSQVPGTGTGQWYFGAGEIFSLNFWVARPLLGGVDPDMRQSKRRRLILPVYAPNVHSRQGWRPSLRHTCSASGQGQCGSGGSHNERRRLPNLHGNGVRGFPPTEIAIGTPEPGGAPKNPK